MVLKNEEIRLALQIALLGEIYSDVRAVVYQYCSQRKSLLIRYYLNRQPNENDYENVSVVMTEVIANFKFSEFNEIKEECFFSDLPNHKLDPLDGFVYLKKDDF